MEFMLYTCLAAGYSLFAAKKTGRFFLGFVLIFWILAKPVLNAHYSFDVPGAGINIAANRLLFICCLGYLIFGLLCKKSSVVSATRDFRRPNFEKYFYFLLFPILFSIAINYKLIPLKSIAAIPLELLIFIVVYVTAKRYMTQSLLDEILKAIIVLSIFSAILVFFQLIVDHDFLRSGEPKIAFGSIYRAFGLFEFDGELGFFQSLSLVILLVRSPPGIKRALCFSLILASIFLTFTRLCYLTAYVSLALYFIFYARERFSFTSAFIVTAIPVLLMSSFVVYDMVGGRSQLIEARLRDDTATGRLKQYEVTAVAMLKYPFGISHYDNPAYTPIMEKYNMVQWFRDKYNMPYTKPLEVHNGFLSVGILYGVLGLLFFSAAMVSLSLYFYRLAKNESRQYIMPLFSVYIWGVSNLTQRNDGFGFYYVLLLAILFGSMVAMYRAKQEISHQLINK